MKIDLGRKIGRREFLVRVVEAGGGAVLAPAVLTVVGLGLPGCGDGGGGGSGGGGGGGPSVMFTVDIGGAPGHTHTFSIPQTNLDTPAGGYAAPTDADSTGHTHVVTLLEADLINIANSVAVNGTSQNIGHDHTYTFV